MKEFDYNLEDIFTGISSTEVNPKSIVRLLECHNVEPDNKDYKLHEEVVDLDADGYDWGNS